MRKPPYSGAASLQGRFFLPRVVPPRPSRTKKYTRYSVFGATVANVTVFFEKSAIIEYTRGRAALPAPSRQRNHTGEGTKDAGHQERRRRRRLRQGKDRHRHRQGERGGRGEGARFQTGDRGDPCLYRGQKEEAHARRRHTGHHRREADGAGALYPRQDVHHLPLQPRPRAQEHAI